MVIRKILSYIAGKQIEKLSSPINGELNVFYINGKYVLNAKSTNYSFGELHKGFQRIFKKLNLKERDFETVLILGFGVGSVASILQEEIKKNCFITAIEKDPVIFDLGKKYFDTNRFKQTDLLETDAIEFVANCRKKFDLIVFDIYIDNKIPSEFESVEFLENMKNLIEQNGLLVFNKDINNHEMYDGLKNLENKFDMILPGNKKLQVMKNNWFFIWENKITK